MKQRVYIGCGTGRCGTVSLSRLIGGCDRAKCTQEMKPHLSWEFDEALFMKRVEYFGNANVNAICDVASYYLPYLKRFIAEFHDIRIVCLKRDKGETIGSFESKIGKRNHWLDHDGVKWRRDRTWDRCFPKYEIQDRRAAIRRYWEDYHREIGGLKNEFHKNVEVFEVDILNSKTGQKQIFDFLEMPEERRNYMEKCRFNTSKRNFLEVAIRDVSDFFLG